MTRKVMSTKGTVVDFDLLKIKQQITDSPKTIDVVARERFIDKRRRRTNRKASEMLAQQEEAKRHAEGAMRLQQEQQKSSPMFEVKPADVVEPAVEKKTEGNTKENFNRKIGK